MLNLKSNKIKYKIKTAAVNEIFSHLKECNENFTPPLDDRVNIEEYAKKIFDKSVTFEAWQDQLLVGFIAAYFNDNFSGSAFITNVSIVRNFMRLGIASRLLNLCIGYASQNNFKKLKLEVNRHNNSAIRLYDRLGFVSYKTNEDTLLMKLEIAKQ